MGRIMTVIGNTAELNTGPGITVLAVNGFLVAGNMTASNTTHGVYIYNSNYGVMVGNTARNNNSSSTATGAGFAIDAATFVTVTGNIAVDDQGSPTQVDGFSFNLTAGSCSDICSTGNTGHGNTNLFHLRGLVLTVGQGAFYGAAPSAPGSATGYAAGTTVGTFHEDDTYTGNVGSTAYTINGIVAALKNLGLVAT